MSLPSSNSQKIGLHCIVCFATWFEERSSDFSFREILTSWHGHETCLIFFYDAKYWLLDTGVVCYEWILKTTNPSMSRFFRRQSTATGTCTLYIASWFIQVPRYFSRANHGFLKDSKDQSKLREDLRVYLPFLTEIGAGCW